MTPCFYHIPQKKTSYVFAYAYGAKPHAPTHIGERTYSYDANGNQLGWEHDQNGTRRNIVWDEENRIQSVFDNGHEKTYKYDDQGSRVIKRGPQGETVYVNQYFTMRNREVGTKHVFAGTTRAVSKLMKQDKPGANPKGKTPVEKDLYFFHPDHLGTSNYITDTQGKLYEHLEYFPFGETWVEESTNTQRTPYLFTSKELDEETGLYYFGARYYDPRTSVWQSGDPAMSKFLRGLSVARDMRESGRGVYESTNLAVYSYAYLRPIHLIDPNGDRPLEKGEIALAQSIFGNSIDYSKVEIYQERFAGVIPVPSNRAMAPNGNIYFHPDNPWYSSDFSKASADHQGLFIHEMTHVWQYQSGESVIGRGIFERSYRYDLGSGKSFDDYGIEAQGNLIMDYFFKLKGHQTRAFGSQTTDPSNTLPGYKGVLKDFLADPNYLRLRNEQRRKEEWENNGD